ncbi:hypothetical protein HanIR_Chr14g0683181 [Helianthus annuus]|nr:hypothetical protein HanIR_Chr14g0683181 [Helianthus annuus]KAJ0484695.1 hypothetical protein HanHA89_Chr14g0559751 [Helianthus annuus]
MLQLLLFIVFFSSFCVDNDILCILVERLYLNEILCCLDVLLRSCVFVFMMIVFCVIVISVERNLVCVLFMCVDIMSNFLLMMIILCVFCFFIFMYVIYVVWMYL